MEHYRKILKSDEWTEFDNIKTDQALGKPRPPVQKPYPADATLIDLVPPDQFTVGDASLKDVIGQRQSQRYFTQASLTLEEFSFLLWATQGVSQVIDGKYYKRNVPSGGNRHSIETYLSVHNVEGLEVGLYRYLPLEHKLLLLDADPEIASKTCHGGFDQTSRYEGQPFHFLRDSAVLFIWATLPYRTEWRYSVVSHKMIAIDAGHICQNLYLACGAIGAGTCSIGAIDRQTMDKVLGLDGEEEFTLYLAPVGKLP